MNMSKTKKKYQRKLKNIGDETLKSLHPIVESSADKIIFLGREILKDFFERVFKVQKKDVIRKGKKNGEKSI